MKTLFITLLAFVFFNNTQLFGQENQDEVTLTVLGEASTSEASKLVALRSAIEQAFGTFVSSNTQILNDELVKDEIVSLSSGNIKSFDVLSQLQLPNGNYLSTIKAVVSISKLQSYSSSKGVSIEFAGGLFAANIKISELAKQNEEKAVQNTVKQIVQISKNIFDFQVANEAPKKNDYKNNYEVKLNVTAKANENYLTIQKLLFSLLEGVNMSDSEKELLNSSNIIFYDVLALIPKKYGKKNKTIGTETKTYYLRSQKSNDLLKGIVSFYIPIAVFNASIDNGIEKISIKKIQKNMANSGYDYKGNYLLKLEGDNLFHYYLDKVVISVGNYSSKENVFFNREYLLNNRGRIPAKYIKYPINIYKLFDDRSCLEDDCRYVQKILAGDLKYHHYSYKLQLNLSHSNNDVHYNYNIIDRRTLEDLQKIKGYTIEPVK